MVTQVVSRPARRAVATTFLITLILLIMSNKQSSVVESEGEGLKRASVAAIHDNDHLKVPEKEFLEIKWDPEGDTWQLWKDNSSCSQYKTRFAIGLPRTYLISFPGSGNTWVRYLLEAATGIFTGSLYFDEILRDGGFLGEFDPIDSRRTIVQKSHCNIFLGKSQIHGDRYAANDPEIPAILILRNPARAVMSFWRYSKAPENARHNMELMKSSFQSPGFHNFAMQSLIRWEMLATDRLLWSTTPILVVSYDRLVDDTIGEVRRMLSFLRVPADEGRLSCLESYLKGSFKRPSDNEFNPFSEKEKKSLSYATKKVNKVLELMGHETLPDFKEFP